MTQLKLCIVIPVYNHGDALPTMLAALEEYNIPVILVDDGSNDACKGVMKQLSAEYSDVILVTRAKNGGKGAAVKTGLSTARDRGYTHALQIDADGQHDTKDIPRFIDMSRQAPNALISGVPAYDQSVPKHRYYARYLTHVWIWINTLSFSIRDSMCGFRVYPVGDSCRLIELANMGDRMDFDSEFMVRWHWQGLAIKQLETKVIYPEQGSSNFRLWADNGLISLMHAKLFVGMLKRFPSLIMRRFNGG